MTQLAREYDIIVKRIGKTPKVFYVDSAEFEEYVDTIMCESPKKDKMLNKGKARFRGILIKRI